MDVPAFLARHPPFDDLDPERLERLLATVEIEHFGPGTVILQQAGGPVTHLYVIRRGSVEVVQDATVVDELGEGEIFGMLSLLGQLEPTATVRAREDTICYLVDAELTTEVLGTGAAVAFVAGTVRRRIGRIEEDVRTAPDTGRYRAVGTLLRRPPVTCDPSTPVGEAAGIMERERVSSLLVPKPDGRMGIVTDRDLRTRVLARGRGHDTPVAEIMTPEATTVPADTMAGEVLLRMLEGGFHHFPVADRDGRILGVVTDTDLMDVGRDTPFALRSAIERARDRVGVSDALRHLPSVVGTLVDAGMDPVDVGHVVGFAIDAATRRLLELGSGELHETPAPWAWLALGSAARQEQAILTDQDHALAFEGDRSTSDGDLARLADFVTTGLEAGGIPRCDANVMATDPRLRLPLDAWIRRFERWIEEDGPTGSEQLSIIVDYRQVAGPLAAEPALDRVVATARTHPPLLRQLVRRALDERPPLGFVRDLAVEHHGEHAGTVDVKRGGIAIVDNLARAHAMRSGVTAKRTLERLRGAEAAGALDAATREALEEAFRFLWEVRLRHQVERYRSGLEPDDFVDPHALGSVARQGLKEAFRIVHRAQRELALTEGMHV